MSKESIRKQIEKLQSEAKAFTDDKSLPRETRFFINSMLSILEIIVAVLLTKKVRKNSSNSGLPPSNDIGSHNDRNKPGDFDRNKRGSQVENTRVVETKETVGPSECKACDTKLSDVEVYETQEREKIDIVYEVIKHAVVSEVKICPECGTKNKGKFPKGMDGKVRYGIGIKATIINFLCVQMVSLERVQEHLKGILGRLISQAVMLKYIAQFSASLEEWEGVMMDKLLHAPYLHVDETSLKVDKKNHWIHTYSQGDITLKFVHQKRGTEAIDDIGIIPRYGGVIIHDCYASYFTYENVDHALCGGHLLRELKFIEESTGDRWATNMKKLLQEAAMTVSKRRSLRVLYEEEFKKLQANYRNILTRAEKELPPFPERQGKKGRLKHTDAQNLWVRFKEHEASILRFARDRNIDFTNNRAERDIRGSKVKQKVSGCFRTLEYARHFCRISSYIKSMRYKGYSAMEALMLALQGNIPI